MEKRLTAYLLETFLRDHFTSKKEMADQMDISYRMLLRVITSECSKRDLKFVMEKVVYFCAAHKIPLEKLLQGFSY